MLQFLNTLFSSDSFMPHGGCYAWTWKLVWLHVLSDAAIGLAYVAISLTLVILVIKGRREIAFHSMFLAFGVFIVACGGTHFMEILTVWNPVYWLSGAVKAVTAVASVFTAIALPPLVPVALEMVHNARLSDERKVELEAAHAELSRVHAQLKQADELKTQLFANVSHELRTPLTLILGPTERMLTAPELESTERRDLETIQRNARLLLRHVNDLLDVARLDAGKLEARYAHLDAARLLRISASHFEAVAAERGIDFRVDAPETLPADLDSDKIQRVLINLLGNAFKFTPDAGRIRCTLKAQDGHVEIAVRDSGPGVPADLREAVFDRFRQAEGGATRRHGGTGLGLAIVKEFVSLHGGTVHIEEAPEGGAAVVVRLPEKSEALAAPAATQDYERAEAVAEEAAELVESQEQPEASSPQGSGATVLVVEDNPELSQFIGEILGEEYRVERAANGKEGLEKVLTLRPDLVLSDMMMPEMSGDEMLRSLRTHSDFDNTPVMMLTARADGDLRAEMLRSGAQDFLLKPFSAIELKARTQNLISARRARQLLQEEVAAQLTSLDALAEEVTARKRQLQSSLESVRVALEHAERASRVKTTFLRMISHELRTPLTTLQLQIHLLERSKDGQSAPQQLEIARRMGSAARRLGDLIESLLDYARIESGRLELQVEDVSLETLARDVVAELAPQAELKHLELRLETEPGLPPLHTDARLSRLILVNLLSNAIKFSPEGAISVGVAAAPEGQRLYVRDAGPGIPADQLSLIFEPFQHLEPVQYKSTPGAGLGLSIVRELTEALGGRVDVESEVGIGSTFSVTLPPAPPGGDSPSTLRAGALAAD